MARKPYPSVEGRDVQLGQVIKIGGRWCRIAQFPLARNQWDRDHGIRYVVVAAPRTDPRAALIGHVGRSVTGRWRMIHDDDSYLTRDTDGPAPEWEWVTRGIDRADGIATPCAVCAAQARLKGFSPFWAARGMDWPTRVIGERVVHLACASEAEHLTAAAADLEISPEGVGRWTASGQVLPGDTAAIMARLGLAPGLDQAATATARDAQTAEFVAAYRAALTVRTPEEIARHEHELRAAFGPGETVVDVITGRETTT